MIESFVQMAQARKSGKWRKRRKVKKQKIPQWLKFILTVWPRKSKVELKQHSGTGYTGPSSLEALDVESSEQALSDSSLVLPEVDCDVGHLQDLEEVARGKSCLPRNAAVTGLAQQSDFQGCELAEVYESSRR